MRGRQTIEPSLSIYPLIDGDDVNPAGLNITSDTKWVQDFRGKNLLIFTSEWNIRWALEKNPGLSLSDFSRN